MEKPQFFGSGGRHGGATPMLRQAQHKHFCGFMYIRLGIRDNRGAFVGMICEVTLLPFPPAQKVTQVAIFFLMAKRSRWLI